MNPGLISGSGIGYEVRDNGMQSCVGDNGEVGLIRKDNYYKGQFSVGHNKKWEDFTIWGNRVGSCNIQDRGSGGCREFSRVGNTARNV